MTRKTGKLAARARQQTRSAKLAKYKRELSEAGVKLSLPKPSAAARRQKEEELRKLYLELFPQKKTDEQAEQPVEQEQPVEESEKPEGEEAGEQTEQQKPAEEKPEEEQAEDQKQTEEQPPEE